MEHFYSYESAKQSGVNGKIYELIHNYDIWGNEEDGWCVNDFTSNGYVLIEESDTDLDVINFLNDFYGESLVESFCDEDYWAFDSGTKPKCELRLCYSYERYVS